MIAQCEICNELESCTVINGHPVCIFCECAIKGI